MSQSKPSPDVDALIAGIRAELSPSPPGPSVDEVMRRVRHEVALRRGTGSLGHDDLAIDPAGRLPRWQAAAPELAAQSEYVLGEFLALDDSAFVEAAYRAVLRRPPDEAGFRHYLSALRESELSKVEILAALRWSPEGEARGVHVDGLLLPYTLHKWQRKPVIGRVIRWLHAWIRLPAMLDRQSREGLRHARESQELGRHVNTVSAQAEQNFARLEAGMALLAGQFEQAEATLSEAAAAQSCTEAELARTQAEVALLVAALAQTEAAQSDTQHEMTTLAAAVVAAQGSLLLTQHDLAAKAAALQGTQAELAATLAQTQAAQSRTDAELASVITTLAATHAALLLTQDELAITAAALNGAQTALDEVDVARRGAQEELQALTARSGELGSDMQRLSEASAATASLVGRVDASLQALHAERDAAAGRANDLDALYARFEERFRGSEALVRERVSQFLPNVAALGPEGLVVDLGCGRGEWLQLMREHGVRATGVDTNQVFLRHCRERGLDVVEADAVAWLKAQPDTSVAGLTSMHLVEHLPFEALMLLLAEAYRVVVPGGLLLLETPNPENLLVATHGFYMDPTHRNPLPPDLLAWLVQSQGFEAVQIERLTQARYLDAPPLVEADAPGAASMNALLQRLHTAPDYAIVARRP